MNTNITLERSELLLTVDDASSNEVVVLFLPGISGKAHSQRFQPLVNVVLKEGMPIARMSAWENSEEVNDKSFSYFQSAVTEAIQHLLSLGYKKIIAVGKSFGGGLLMSLHHNAIVKKVLWAPAIGISDVETISEMKELKLAQIHGLQDITLSPPFVREDSASIRIVHGTGDDVMPVSTSREMVSIHPDGKMIEVAGADHSFDTQESEAALMSATSMFLKS